MNRDVERAAAKLVKECRECGPCYSFEDVPECDVETLSEAAEELLEELRRAGVIPAAL